MGHDKLTPKDLTTNLIKWMSYGGCNPFERLSKRRFIGYIYVSISALIVILLMLNFIFTPHNSVSSLMEDSIMFFGFMQVGAKHFTSIQKSDFIAKMLESSWNDFWSIDTCDEKFKKSALTLYKTAKYLANIYSFVVMFASCLFIIQAGITGNKSLVMEIWIPHKEILKTSPYYEMMYIFQGVFMLTAVWFSLIQLDRMFILMTCFVCVQQQMIQLKLCTIKKTNTSMSNLEIVRSCVVHQNVVFRFLQHFEVVFSRLFLPTLGTNFILTSLTMYGAIMEDSLNRKLTSIFIYLSVTGQLFAYCYAGYLIQEEGIRIGEAAYNSDWYDLDDISIRKHLLLVALRSQRKIELTVGGFMILSLENFATVVRTSFSFLTFIVNMRT